MFRTTNILLLKTLYFIGFSFCGRNPNQTKHRLQKQKPKPVIQSIVPSRMLENVGLFVQIQNLKTQSH